MDPHAVQMTDEAPYTNDHYRNDLLVPTLCNFRTNSVQYVRATLKNAQKQVLRMDLPIVGFISEPKSNVFSLSRASQVPYNKKSEFRNVHMFPLYYPRYFPK